MKLLLVLGPKGGAGKTTLARNLAVCAAAAGMRTAVLDTDPQGTLAGWWVLRNEDRPRIDLYREPLKDLIKVPTALDDADLLVIDTPTAIENHPQQTESLIRAADLVLMPIRPTPEDSRSLVAAMRYVRSINPRAAFVPSQVNPRLKETIIVRRKLAGEGDVAPVDIPSLAEVYRTYEQGLGVIEVAGARAAADFEALWRFVADRLGLVLP
jgi:chromosome partitioning protein